MLPLGECKRALLPIAKLLQSLLLAPIIIIIIAQVVQKIHDKQKYSQKQ